MYVMYIYNIYMYVCILACIYVFVHSYIYFDIGSDLPCPLLRCLLLYPEGAARPGDCLPEQPHRERCTHPFEEQGQEKKIVITILTNDDDYI